MFRFSSRSVAAASTLIFAAGVVSALFAQTYDYSHRISTATVSKDLNAKAGQDVKATLIRNHFGFGGQINAWSFDTIIKGEAGVTQNYFDAFRQYFDYATPENEMKWTSNMWGDTMPSGAWYDPADRIIDSCDKYGIKVRGHNLFWNEKKDWIPKWSRELGTTDFKKAMKDRIESAMTHFKGKVVQWDIINEIIHGENGSTPAAGQGLLETMSGDQNVFAWILDEARKIDSCPFVINDYNLATANDYDKYVTKCLPLKEKFDIIGDEGHFSDAVFSRSDIDTKINKMATGLGKKAWFTEIDWSFAVSKSPEQMELLMRTSFANKNIDGMVLWVWCKRKMWRELNSYLVDSLFVETETGKTWKKLRKEWKTDTTVKAEADGGLKFKGYQGQYQLVQGDDTAIVYLHPEDKVEIIKAFEGSIAIQPNSAQSKVQSATVRLNGTTINLPMGLSENKQLYLSAYTISGKFISKIPLTFHNGNATVSMLPLDGNTYRIGTADKTYHTGMGVQVR